ncbi:serine-rich adhesin for platelets isoform X1 [Phlebotomus argentipes]|uniref:serine-rich adhesin for platelets isoform X1 n=1 Tax=Phlebotomus argentipes TaxID=94469 RepID=UPI002892DFF4|nr:serine-rich adhesin for platelets isoform X1 [Phlebotomus argentipes]XP_059617184.1 serine-rich adhesin for platelets isoform X1 [Phlebotomus argentipes]
MEVAIGNAAPPFQREVREWQRVDPNTGALLTGRLEADRWIRDHMNTYGKVVDSQNVSTPNGTHHSQRKQLEVLQARTATGGAVQVVRSQTVHTSSSRWNSSAKQNGINGTNFTSSAHSSPLSFQHKKLHGETQKTVTPYAPEPTLPASSAMNSTSSPPSGGVGGHRKQLDPNERETAALNSHGSLNRGKSVSNEDLADDDPEPCEWKRVSKIRRSLQYPKATSPAKYSSRPLDLPENLVSVSRIRQELENGRRLDRAMRNNHVDLAALDSILKGAPDPDHKPEVKSTKKATFITAESLKEIRGKLRKLSDESLYKDDILVQNDEDEVKRNGLTMNESRTDAMQPSTYASHLATTTPSGGFVFKPKVMANGNSNSLQSRNKVKDLANNEWHYRRKSYGFEKMTPPPESMTSRMETSTDSGIGRSGDISSSWSPTENAPRGTVITLAGDDGKEALGKSTSVTILSNGGSQINSVVTPLRPNSIYFNGKPEEVKRHSIAVDESKYVKEPMRRTFEPAKTSSIHINGSPGSDSKTDDDLKRGQKRVEFCKTEVHFAAESGRVNIIETDGKPPPTNNFRRRRRSSGGSIGSTYLEAIKSGVPLTHFGDSEQPPEQPKPSADLENNIRSSPTITTPTVTTTTSTATNGVRSAKEEEEDSNDEISLRGILKNKPVKPRPYHLGENIENSESLWGVRLRPVSTDCTLWTRDASQKSPPLIPDDSDCNSGFHSDSNESVRSVAERVRIVEQLRNKDSPTGFSTKVNLTSSQSFNWPLRDETNPMPQSRFTVHLTDGESDETGLIGFEKSHDSSLKSTTLIMKTLKSAQQFDEAMAKLASVNPAIIVPQSKITEKDIPTDFQRGNRLSSYSVAKSSSASNILGSVAKLKVKEKYSSSLDGNGDYDRDWNFDDKPLSTFSSLLDKRKPVAAPRLKKLGNSSVLSQLSQLNRMYEAAGQDSDGSAQADEEVNLIFGQSNRMQPEEKTTTLSGSWSRLRSKRNCTKQTSPNYAHLENYKPRVSPAKADIIHSNLLSIPLHSPTNSLRKPTPKTETPIMTRTTSPVKTTPIAIRKSLPTTDSKIISQEKEKPKSAQEPLKLVCGTRKLRDHELSYFGVNTTQQRASVTNDAKKLTNHAKTETPSRWKWTEKTDSQSRKEPIYENLKYHSNSTSNVVRHPNYDRDQDILDELNRAADEILSSVSKNHDAEESRTRRRIQSKPLETITEARSSTPKSVQSRGIQVSRGGSESVRRSGVARSSCRVSSASSSESIPRQIPSSSLRASTHSSSSKSRHSTRSHEDSSSTRSSKRRVTSMTECRRLHRTSSRDTVPSQASSSEDVNEPRRPRRLKVKEKPESSVTAESKRSTSSSKSSSRRHSKPEGTSSRPSRSTSDHHQKIRVKSGIVTTTSSRNGSNWLLRESRIE